ncbi:hypothetical protein QOZ83_13465 [Romboutsia sedimentorum]|uniref:hypothetical protein n=1 Tax=Romboutsia sedimentorum TaxID=1368474 RepID=UPI0024DEA000|nr:hypothetical protein [Romboutsia sedimentorum]MDK2586868.1 hypothetical protein [Romboutsia sedimentorum]
MKLSKILCKDKEERIYFNFVSSIIRKDRDFKSIIYPIMGSNLVAVFVIPDRNEWHLSSYSFLPLYLFVCSVPTIIIALKYCENYKASYIYTTIPIKNKMNVHKAAIKACFVNIIIPLYLIISGIFVSFYGVNIIQHLIVIFLVNIFIAINTFKILDKSMPFTRQIRMFKNIFAINYSISENYLMIILTCIMAGIHFIVSIFGTLAVNVYIIVILIVNIYLFKSSFKMN